MDSIKTMPYWSDEDYSYPLPDVSHLSRKKALKLRAKGIDFVTFGFRDRIKSDEEFEACITLVAQWNNQCNIDEGTLSLLVVSWPALAGFAKEDASLY